MTSEHYFCGLKPVKILKYIFFTILAARAPAAPRSRPGGGGASVAQIEELNAIILEKNLTIEGLEKERDFYFGKLRDIEVMAQEQEGATVESTPGEFGQKILEMLYATEVNTLDLRISRQQNQFLVTECFLTIIIQIGKFWGNLEICRKS